MKNIPQILIFILVFFLFSCSDKNQDEINSDSSQDDTTALQPPYDGTVWLNPNIITEEDSSLFQSITSTGRGMRTMFDRRVDDWISVNAYLFEAVYDSNITVEIQVNPEFEETVASNYAEEYANYIGRLPRGLFRDLQTVWVNDGDESFGGGNNNILIHVGLANQIKNDGFMEEILFHEATHTSLDSYHMNNPDWSNAQINDPTFISTYARDNPDREDIAETFLLYFALRYNPESLSVAQRNTILTTIPNRIEYFDNQEFDYFPF